MKKKKSNKSMIRVILLCAVLALILIILAAMCGQEQKELEERKYCRSFPYYGCPGECMVCPPCAECSSLSCGTEEFCESIGFGREWYGAITARLNESE